MEIEKLVEELRTKSLCSEKANLEIMDLCMEAAAQLERLNDFSNSQMEVLLAENTALKAIINEPENAIHRRALHEVSQVKAENAALKALRFSLFTETEVYILKRMCMECGQIFAEKAYTEKDSAVLYSLHEEILAHIRRERAIKKYTEAAEKTKEAPNETD